MATFQSYSQKYTWGGGGGRSPAPDKIGLNTIKTHFVPYGFLCITKADSFRLHLNNKQITQTKSILKYLDVLIDSNLNWKEHILNMSKKIAKSIGIICKLRHFVNTETVVQLYNAIIYPFLTCSTYCSNIKPLEISYYCHFH